MSRSTAFSSEGSTFLKGSPSAQPFNSTVKRFGPAQDFKEMFNRDPGPGQYSVISTAADSMISGSAQSTITQFNV